MRDVIWAISVTKQTYYKRCETPPGLSLSCIHSNLYTYKDIFVLESESPRNVTSRISRSVSPLITPSFSQTPVEGPSVLPQEVIAAPTAANIPMEVTTTVDVDLDSEILAALGEAPKTEVKFGNATHKDLATRWQDILGKGLSKEVKDKILDEYLIPDNCRLLVAPSLNSEVKVALAENMVKRDSSMLAKQKQLSIAIAALNKAIEMTIAKDDHTKILKPISDACRLLCDSHFMDTRTRRGFVISSINPEMKETLIETKRDSSLFGEDVAEKLKSAKSIKRSAADLKQVKNDRSQVFNKANFIKHNRNTPNNRLNWKTMPRKITPRSEPARFRQSHRVPPVTNSQQRGHHEASERTTATTNNRRR